MGDPATAMRDPAFYRWHQMVDDAFQVYKQTLAPYSEQQLNFGGVQITGLSLQTEGGQANVLQTFWQQSDVNLTNGLDFSPRGNVFVRITHLQHNPFTYNITVNNSAGAQRLGMVRIFMAPKFNERRQEFPYNEKRRFMIEVERFIAASK